MATAMATCTCASGGSARPFKQRAKGKTAGICRALRRQGRPDRTGIFRKGQKVFPLDSTRLGRAGRRCRTAGENNCMHRFYLPPELGNGNRLQLDGREAHHAIESAAPAAWRMRSPCWMAQATNSFAQLESVSRQALSLAVKEKTVHPRPALPRSPCWWPFPREKSSRISSRNPLSLGAHRIVPLLTERVVMQLDDEGSEQKREKWQQVAIEAIKQCGAAGCRNRSPAIDCRIFWHGATTLNLPLVGALTSPRRHPRECFEEFQKQHGRLPRSAGIWIGPEGDFTPEELQADSSIRRASGHAGKLDTARGNRGSLRFDFELELGSFA